MLVGSVLVAESVAGPLDARSFEASIWNLAPMPQQELAIVSSVAAGTAWPSSLDRRSAVEFHLVLL